MTGTRIINHNEATKIPKSEFTPSEKSSVLVVPIHAISSERTIAKCLSSKSAALKHITCYVIACSTIICARPRK
jgi:hypothetical protein